MPRRRTRGPGEGQKRTPRKRARGPGEPLKRESLVTIEMDSLEAGLFAPKDLERVLAERPGIVAQNRTDVVELKYIVTTRRYENVWEVTIEHKGDVWKLPGKVVERIASQKEAIIAEQRSINGANSAEIARRRAAPPCAQEHQRSLSRAAARRQREAAKKRREDLARKEREGVEGKP